MEKIIIRKNGRGGADHRNQDIEPTHIPLLPARCPIATGRHIIDSRMWLKRAHPYIFSHREKNGCVGWFAYLRADVLLGCLGGAARLGLVLAALLHIRAEHLLARDILR